MTKAQKLTIACDLVRTAIQRAGLGSASHVVINHVMPDKPTVVMSGTGRGHTSVLIVVPPSDQERLFQIEAMIESESMREHFALLRTPAFRSIDIGFGLAELHLTTEPQANVKCVGEEDINYN